jgi:endonuclease/exonuclease/phosphatase family metal-dependent hydrolase|tara:strand:+ start:9397 stop:10329 length:933 start_codon:yes stop_codon:yes gene_type:complete
MNVMGGFIKIPLLTLLVPLLSMINLVFFLIWLLRFQWPALLFIAVLAISLQEWKLLYQFENSGITTSKGLHVMSYNVRSFNRFEWLKHDDVSSSIESFINESKADVICFQEFSKEEAPEFKDYPYQAFKPYVNGGKIGTSIISKYPLVNSKLISFEGSQNGGMQSDLIWKKDTLRFYNLHFESFRLNRSDSLISSNYSEKIRRKLQAVFEIQSNQVSQFNTLSQSNSYPEVICTDLNNNAFSEPYRLLSKTRVDSFTEAGAGLGTTCYFSILPLRIDFIFTSKTLRVIDYKTHEVKLSDHRPISAKLSKG